MPSNGQSKRESSHADPLDAYMELVKEKIETFGWMAQAVFPTRDDPTGEYFVYTVGLHGRGHPEFILAGLDQESAHMILTKLAKRVLNGEQFAEGKYGDVLIGGYQVELVRCSKTVVDGHLRIAQRFANADVEAFQVFWPDPEGMLPSNPSCGRAFAEVQWLQ